MTDSTKTINSVHVFSEQQQAVTGSDIIQQLNDNDGTVFVFYSHPSVYVAEQLKQQNNGDDACSEWLDRINDALSAQRQNRRRIRLLCLQDALEHPQALIEQTGLDVSVLAGFDVKPDGLELMAGHQLVLQNEDIMALIERLEASTLQLSERAYHVAVNVEQILSDVVETKRELAEKGEESELLLLQVEQLQHELEEVLVKLKKADTSPVNNNTDTDITEENQLLTLQLEQVQEELKVYYLKHQDISKKIASYDKKYKNCSKKLHEKEALVVSLSKENKAKQRENQDLKQQIERLKNPPTLIDKIKKKIGFNNKLTTEQKRIKSDVKCIENSDYFDAEWYLSKYPDLAKSGLSPAEHYLRFGGFESRTPSNKFDSSFYLNMYPDVFAEGVNPLLHFERYGKAEGRLPKPKDE